VNSGARTAQGIASTVEFGGFRLDLRRRKLHSPAGSLVPLTPRVLDTLICLVRNPGVLQSRERLMDSIWPDSAVEPNNLNQNIAKLRRLFCSARGENPYIETVPGRGYRFIADVRVVRALVRPEPDGTDELADPEARQLYLQALRLLQRPTPQNCQGAIDRLGEALVREPGCARAWAWLADAHLLSVNVGHAGPAGLEAAEHGARHALGLQGTLAVAHAVLATAHALRQDWLVAESHFMTALSLDPDDAMTRTLHASFLLQQVGHGRRALAQLRGAFDLKPDDPRMLMNLAMASCIAGQDEQALHCARLATDFGYPEAAYPLPLLFMHVAARAGRYSEAAARAAGLPGFEERERQDIHAIHAAFADPGAMRSAQSVLKELLERRFDQLLAVRGLLLLVVQWFVRLDQLDLAFEMLERALDAGSRRKAPPQHWQTLWMPEMQPFRRDARFGALSERLGFPRYWSVLGAPDA
jgi:DNA-binding winged helix-turn-helix (wHTH) protein/Tfp pilus assembly protein PilF